MNFGELCIDSDIFQLEFFRRKSHNSVTDLPIPLEKLNGPIKMLKIPLKILNPLMFLRFAG